MTRGKKNIKHSGKKKITKRKKSNDGYLSIICCTIILIFIVFITIYNNSIINKKVQEINKKLESIDMEPILENITPHYVFLGDSITQQYELSKYFNGYSVVNSGEDGNQTTHILDNMEERVYRYNPSTVIVMIGTNDINENHSTEDIYNNIKKIIEEIQINLPKTNIIVESIFPSQENWSEYDRNDKRQEINQLLAEEYKNSEVIYLDLYSMLIDADTNKLKSEYTNDGLHLNDKSYKVITAELKKYMSMHNSVN